MSIDDVVNTYLNEVDMKSLMDKNTIPRSDLRQSPEAKKTYPKTRNASISLQQYQGTSYFQWYVSKVGGIWHPTGKPFEIKE